MYNIYYLFNWGLTKRKKVVKYFKSIGSSWRFLFRRRYVIRHHAERPDNVSNNKTFAAKIICVRGLVFLCLCAGKFWRFVFL